MGEGRQTIRGAYDRSRVGAFQVAHASPIGCVGSEGNFVYFIGEEGFVHTTWNAQWVSHRKSRWQCFP